MYIDKTDGVVSRHEMAPLMKCITLPTPATCLRLTINSSIQTLSPAMNKVGVLRRIWYRNDM